MRTLLSWVEWFLWEFSVDTTFITRVNYVPYIHNFNRVYKVAKYLLATYLIFIKEVEKFSE